MAVNVSQQEYYTFVAGLNTEAGYFTFPPNTFKEASNIKLNIDGSFQKRLAVDFEDNYETFNQISVAQANSYGYTVYTWEAVNSDGNVNFFIVQVGPSLLFFQAVSGAVSATYQFSFDLTPYKVANSNPLGQALIKATPAGGKLLVTSQDTEPLLLTYDIDTGSVRATKITLQMRDFEGVDDGLAVDYRPTTLSQQHKYNLLNQGWDASKIDAYKNSTGYYPSGAQAWVYGKTATSATDPTTADTFVPSFLDKQDFGTSPAPKGRYILDIFKRDRAGVAGLGTVGTGTQKAVTNISKDIDGTILATVPAHGITTETTAIVNISYLYTSNFGGTETKSISGTYSISVIDASTIKINVSFPVQSYTVSTTANFSFKLVTTTVTYTYTGFTSGIVEYGTTNSDLATYTEYYRPTVCAFYAGRAWYAGVQSNKIGSWVMFSQVGTTDDKYGKCYQDNDPTAEIINDLIASDGGVIPIQDAGEIVDLVPVGNGMMVFASNGVWQVGGTANSGFSASSYEVNKITTVGCTSQKSIVSVDGGLLYWTNSGIYALQSDNLGGYSAQSLTDLTIKSLYNAIPSFGKETAVGEVNTAEKIVYWIYNDTGETAYGNQPYRVNKILVLDLRLKAFYVHEIEESVHDTYLESPYIVDIIVTKESATEAVQFDVISNNGSTVVDAATNTVVANLNAQVAGTRQFKFLTVVPTSTSTVKFTFSDFTRSNDAPSKFKDWYRFNGGTAYDCYAITGYGLAPNGASKVKQLQYVTTYLKRTETGVDANGNSINDSSCKLQVRWDFTSSAVANKWSTEEEVYRHRRYFIHDVPATTYEDGYPLVISKSKVRGRGKAVQFKFSAEPEYDMQIVGWTATTIGATNV